MLVSVSTKARASYDVSGGVEMGAASTIEVPRATLGAVGAVCRYNGILLLLMLQWVTLRTARDGALNSMLL
jgi:hypothetical protein